MRCNRWSAVSTDTVGPGHGPRSLCAALVERSGLVGARHPVSITSPRYPTAGADVPGGLQRDLEPLGVHRRGLGAPRSISESVITASPQSRCRRRGGTDGHSQRDRSGRDVERSLEQWARIRLGCPRLEGPRACVTWAADRRDDQPRYSRCARGDESTPSGGCCAVASRVDWAGGRVTGSLHNQGGQDLVQPGRRTAEGSIVERAGGWRSAGCRVG
jgi:hypothetical protein